MTKKEENELLDCLLETYSDNELEEIEKAIKQEEAEGIYRYEPSERMDEAMRQLIEDLPEIQKKERRKRLFDCIEDVSKFCLTTATTLALLFLFANAVARPHAFVASVNQIILNVKTTFSNWMHFTVDENADSPMEKDVSELVIEVGYLPNGCALESDGYEGNNKRALTCAGLSGAKIYLYVSVPQESELVIVGQDCSVFLVGGREVTMVKTNQGYDTYTWMQSDYLCVLNVTGYSMEEAKKVIASITIE